ncbi:uncharacterized protein LODBEIA_P02640 [Lodderomyces beijingensis]|uniref:Ribosomal RNA-processing protein 17 n=1 Tax=Lodderomyces beijingensis TaxID=1775926 RepID=A0ABP0ZCZ2_9ASCO
MVRQNREILTGGKSYAQRQAKKHSVNEVTFDKDKRHEYLTGFHKRKVQRQKKAQEYNKEQERLAKIAERKQLRDERKQDLENQLTEFNEKAKEIAMINGDLAPSDDDDGAEDGEDNWDGFDDQDGEVDRNGDDDEEDGDGGADHETRPLKGILHRTEVYQPSSNDGFDDDTTTVTIDSIDHPSFSSSSLEEAAKSNNVDLQKSDQVLEKSVKRAKNYAVFCGVAKPSKEKKPKKKFRYLSKAERRANTRKEKSKGKLRGKK